MAGLSSSSCWTIGAPSVQGTSLCPFIVSDSSGIRIYVLLIARHLLFLFCLFSPKQENTWSSKYADHNSASLHHSFIVHALYSNNKV